MLTTNKASNEILVIGATSTIVRHLLRLYATPETRFYLVARDEEKLKIVSSDLIARGAEGVEIYLTDFNDALVLSEVVKSVLNKHSDITLAIVGHGMLIDQSNNYSTADSVEQVHVNFTTAIACLEPIANAFEKRRIGSIVALSSVAGDRGRASNYLYGSTKAALSVYLQGLRNRLHHSGVSVLTVKPGIVDTDMTQHMRKTKLFADPTKVATDIYQAQINSKDVLYTPSLWRLIMLVIRLIPEPIFKRLKKL